MFTLQRRFVLSGFHPIIELKTSKHEFADIIHQNKQGFDGKKLSEGVSTTFAANRCVKLKTPWGLELGT